MTNMIPENDESETSSSTPKQQTEQERDERDILEIIDFIFNSARPPTLIEIAVGLKMPEKRADYLVGFLVRGTSAIEPVPSWKIIRPFDPVGYELTLLGKQIAQRKRAA
jgi:hypothetical protein